MTVTRELRTENGEPGTEDREPGTGNRDPKREDARKVVHIFFGLFAFTLRWLSTLEAAIVAGSALLFNRFVLRRVGGSFIARTTLGYDLGIVLYPLAVLVLILSFPARPELAAVAWVILGFGDGMATIVGRHIPLRPLPWNATKSWSGLMSFTLAAFPVSLLVWWFVTGATPSSGETLMIGAVVVISAIAESLDLNLDDNFVVPLVSGLSLALIATFDTVPMAAPDMTALIWIGVNALLAVTGYVARSVSMSGMIGGFVLGTVLIMFAGWQLYVVLLIFFVVGSSVTKIGYREKESAGLAQESGGRRGFSHAFSNVGVATILALSIPASTLDPIVLWVAAIASLATATADTTASEIGQLYGKRAFLPLTLKRVPVGTEGAISVEGTLAGAVAAIGVGVASIWLIPFELPGVAVAVIVAGSAIAGSWLESVVGSWNRQRRQRVPNGALNFFNTLVGALIALVAASIIL